MPGPLVGSHRSLTLNVGHTAASRIRTELLLGCSLGQAIEDVHPISAISTVAPQEFMLYIGPAVTRSALKVVLSKVFRLLPVYSLHRAEIVVDSSHGVPPLVERFCQALRQDLRLQCLQLCQVNLNMGRRYRSFAVSSVFLFDELVHPIEDTAPTWVTEDDALYSLEILPQRPETSIQELEIAYINISTLLEDTRHLKVFKVPIGAYEYFENAIQNATALPHLVEIEFVDSYIPGEDSMEPGRAEAAVIWATDGIVSALGGVNHVVAIVPKRLREHMEVAVETYRFDHPTNPWPYPAGESLIIYKS